MQRIGIMQGRMGPPEEGRFQSFPRQSWGKEFGLAAQAGLESIEWIDDMWGESVNPLASDEGIEQMKALSRQHGIAVVSLCADYFMECPLLRAEPAELRRRVERMLWILSRCQRAGITRIVVPFVDNSRIDNAADRAQAMAVLREIVPPAAQANIEIHLETSLGPKEFAALLDEMPFANLKANYDIGNSASLGFDHREELAAYGTRIGSVHIKDRLRGAGTVPLGTGNANIPGVLEGLARLGYAGDYILQVARGTPGDEVEWTRRNLATVRSYLAAAKAHGGAR